MGKLHSLKKEIKREPHRWFSFAPVERTIFGKIPCGAAFVDGKWFPVTNKTAGQNQFAYALFVRKVLEDLGIRTDRPRPVAGVGRTYNWTGKQHE